MVGRPEEGVGRTRARRTSGAAGRLGLAASIAAALAWGCGADSPAAPEEPGPTPELVSLDRMGPGETYHGLPGGLVENGEPTVTPEEGRIVIIAISMSNGRQEFARFIDLFGGHPEVDPAIGLVNCARGGNALERWLSEPALWEGCRRRVSEAGFSLDQVKVVWAKDANQFTDHGRTLPDPGADYFDLVENISALSRRIGHELPSVQAIFHTSRIYGGYVTDSRQPARGEPISYEGGLAVNETIRRWQRGELEGSPWLGWGPYVWANGTTPNASGIRWERADFEGGDGDDPHPSLAGETKVAEALHAFFMEFDWYAR